MNAKQAKAIETLRAVFVKTYGYSADYELKVDEVHEHEGYGFVSVVLEIGMKGDEGTAGSLFCRTRLQAFVGVRGGVSGYRPVYANGKRRSIHGLWNVVLECKSH